MRVKATAETLLAFAVLGGGSVSCANAEKEAGRSAAAKVHLGSPPVAISSGPAATSASSSRPKVAGAGFLADDACDPSCKTCDTSSNPLKCLTCADGSDVKIISESKGTGFCGEACTLCYDGLVPEEPDNTYWHWPDNTRSSCNRQYAEHWEFGQVPAGNGVCTWFQKETYLQCGCPKLPPLPPPPVVDDGESQDPCTICSSGSDPAKPDADVLRHPGGATTCSRLADAFAYPRSAVFRAQGSYITDDSLQCSLEQNDYYEVCGCPKPEVNEKACTLCYDGAPVPAEYSSVVPKKADHYFWEGKTCGEIEAELPWNGHGRGSGICFLDNKMGSDVCGCAPVPTPAPTPAPTLPSAAIANKFDWISALVSWCAGVIVVVQALNC